MKKKKYIKKSFEFEVAYYNWTSNSKNERYIDRLKLKINNIKLNYSGDRFYMDINSTILDKDVNLWIEFDTSSEYIDLEKGYGANSIRVLEVNEPKSRRQKREDDAKFPRIGNFDVAPSKYDTMEFIKEMTELLTQMNDQIKNREH